MATQALDFDDDGDIAMEEAPQELAAELIVDFPDGKEINFPLFQGTNTVGRDLTRNRITIHHNTVSSCHCVVDVSSTAQCWVTDLGSTNKTKLITGQCPAGTGGTVSVLEPKCKYQIQHGNLLVLGSVRCRFALVAPAGEATLAPAPTPAPTPALASVQPKASSGEKQERTAVSEDKRCAEDAEEEGRTEKEVQKEVETEVIDVDATLDPAGYSDNDLEELDTEVDLSADKAGGLSGSESDMDLTTLQFEKPRPPERTEKGDGCGDDGDKTPEYREKESDLGSDDDGAPTQAYDLVDREDVEMGEGPTQAYDMEEEDSFDGQDETAQMLLLPRPSDLDEPETGQSKIEKAAKHAEEARNTEEKDKEEERKKKEEDAKLAKEEEERRAKVAEEKAKEEAERRAKEVEERKAREEAERRRAKEEEERKAREEEEKRAKEAEEKERAEAERKAKEEEERKAKEEAERKAEEDRKSKEEAEREELRKAQEEEERKAQEEEKKAKQEEERKAKEEERKARAEEEKKTEERHTEEKEKNLKEKDRREERLEQEKKEKEDKEKAMAEKEKLKPSSESTTLSNLSASWEKRQKTPKRTAPAAFDDGNDGESDSDLLEESFTGSPKRASDENMADITDPPTGEIAAGEMEWSVKEKAPSKGRKRDAPELENEDGPSSPVIGSDGRAVASDSDVDLVLEGEDDSRDYDLPEGPGSAVDEEADTEDAGNDSAEACGNEEEDVGHDHDNGNDDDDDDEDEEDDDDTLVSDISDEDADKEDELATRTSGRKRKAPAETAILPKRPRRSRPTATPPTLTTRRSRRGQQSQEDEEEEAEKARLTRKRSQRSSISEGVSKVTGKRSTRASADGETETPKRKSRRTAVVEQKEVKKPRKAQRGAKKAAVDALSNESEEKKSTSAKKKAPLTRRSSSRISASQEEDASPSKAKVKTKVKASPRTPAKASPRTPAKASPSTTNTPKKSRRRSSMTKEEEREEEPITPENADLPCILFTGLKDVEHWEKIVKQLKGRLAKSMETATHLVTDHVQRTVKFLQAVCYGKEIVSTSWLTASKRDGKWLPTASYAVSDKRAESKWGFSLPESLKSARECKFLTGYTIYCTRSTRPSATDLKKIIESAGGTVTTKMPRAKQDNLLVVSSPADKGTYEALVKKGYSIYTVELILTGAMRQALELEEPENVLIGEAKE